MKLTALKPIAQTLVRELFITALLLLGVSFVVFVILYLAPGDPFTALLQGQISAGGGHPPATWYGQYLSWLGEMSQANFGTSLRTGLPVLSETVRVGINTLYLTIGAMFITLAVAVPIALASARQGATLVTLPLTLFAYVVSALPIFWLGYIVIYISTHKFGYFPVSVGFSSSGNPGIVSFILPIAVLGVGNGTISEVVRYLREEMERVFSEDYIRTAAAKGGSIWKHSFKEGFLIPVTQIIASKIPYILGGAVVVEQVFNWPGMGRMAWQAAQDRDYPIIMGIAILAAVIVRMGSLLQRVIYVMVNPRASQE